MGDVNDKNVQQRVAVLEVLHDACSQNIINDILRLQADMKEIQGKYISIDKKIDELNYVYGLPQKFVSLLVLIMSFSILAMNFWSVVISPIATQPTQSQHQHTDTHPN